jgi:putative adhesin
MSKLERAWQSDAFDAIGIVALDGQFQIEGTDGEQVELEAEFEARATRDLVLEPAGRWLQLHLWERPGEAQFTVRLPKKKAWVVDISAGRGEVQVNGIQARLRVMVGKGEIQIKDCRGIFNLASGKGEVELEHCVEAEMPERPPLPQPQFQAAHVPEPPPISGTPPMPGGPGMAGEFRVHFGRGPRMRHKMKPDVAWDWFGFDAEDWAEWGAQFGEQARVWAQQFVSHFVGTAEWFPEKAGVSVQIGKGAARLQEIEAKSCRVRLASGDVEFDGGRIESLGVDVSHGDIECDSVLPVGDWTIEIKNGNIHLSLLSNTQARLDVATRHGDIDSKVPLVRVGRPGPESRYGGRMVGTIGQADGNIAQVSLTALRGDIEIRLKQEKSRFESKQAPAPPPSEAKAPEGNPAGASSTQAAAGGVTAATPSTGVGSAAAETDKPETAQAASVYESQLAILQALSAGQISVEEAAKLLRSMEHPADE